MAVRKSEIRRLRRELISRTARVWSRLNKLLVKELNEIANGWLKEIISEQRVSEDFPELPEKFIKVLNKNLREAMAYGYWLSYLYVQGLSGNKYRGKISLSDQDDSTREGLIDFIAGEWNDVIPEDAVKWLEGYTPKLAGNFSNAVLEKTRDVIRESMLAGDTLQERMKALRSSIPELSELSRHRIEAIARTEITRADTMGRLISAKANDDVIGFEFSAIMDDRTTDMCALRHGLFMKIDDPLLAFNTPPLHVNCRSLLNPVTIYEYPEGIETSIEFNEVPASNVRPEDIETIKEFLKSDFKIEASRLMQAHTIEEANRFAVYYGLSLEADFTGLDIIVVNTLIRRIDEAKRTFSKVEPLNFIGSMSQKDFFMMNDEVNAQYSISNNSIGLNPNKFSSSAIEKTIKELELAEKLKLYPIGCNTVESTCDHEIGHWVSIIVNAHEDKEILRLYELYKSNMKLKLSFYAGTSVEEFLAESWNEIRNNKTPRSLAVNVMRRVLRLHGGLIF